MNMEKKVYHLYKPALYQQANMCHAVRKGKTQLHNTNLRKKLMAYIFGPIFL